MDDDVVGDVLDLIGDLIWSDSGGYADTWGTDPDGGWGWVLAVVLLLLVLAVALVAAWATAKGV